MAGARETVAELAARLRDEIARGQLTTDGRLPAERDMAVQLGIGRTRLRQALEILTQEGLLFRRRGQGTFVAPPPATDAARLAPLARRVSPAQMMEVRQQIEPALAGLAASRATDAERAQFAQLAEATLTPKDHDSYEAADDLFHYKIAEMARNPLFLTMYEAIRSVRSHTSWIRPRAETYSRATTDLLARQHQTLAQAIIDGDDTAARATMQAHLASVADVLLSAQDRDEGED